MSYSEIFLQYFNRLDHAGDNFNPESGGVSAQVGCIASEDCVRLSLLLKDGVIQNAHFKAAGMPMMFAAAEFLCRWVQGRTIAECVENLSHTLVLEALEMSAHYIHNVKLVCDCFKLCLDQFEELLI